MRVCFGATTTFCFLLVACALLLPLSTRAFAPSTVVNGPSAIIGRKLSLPFSRGAPILSVYNSDEHEEEWLQRELAALEQEQQDEADNIRNTNYKTRNTQATRAVGPGRAGGRNRRNKTNHYSATTKSSSSPWNNNGWMLKAGIPVLAIAILVKSLFLGGGDTTSAVTSSHSVYYYKSSYYESRVYTGNGNMERTQRSSVESNVPSFMPGNAGSTLRQQSLLDPAASKDTSPGRNAIQNKGDVDAALVKVQQAMFTDWY